MDLIGLRNNLRSFSEYLSPSAFLTVRAIIGMYWNTETWKKGVAKTSVKPKALNNKITKFLTV